NTLTTNNGVFFAENGKVGIGNNTPNWKFTVNGQVGSALDGPHATFITSTDQYPTMQLLNWNHNDTWLTFDSYHDGTFKSSTTTGNFAIAKTGNMLRLMYGSAAPGSLLAFSPGL